MSRLTADALELLKTVDDAWKMQPSEYAPGAVMRSLKALGLVSIKRSRPGAVSPFRFYIRRTADGRRELGLETSQPEGQH